MDAHCTIGQVGVVHDVPSTLFKQELREWFHLMTLRHLSQIGGKRIKIWVTHFTPRPALNQLL